MENKQLKKDTYQLVDNFGRKHNYLRLSITDQCNLRCSYCMPSNPVFLPHKNILTRNEIKTLTYELVDLGITKIRLTGGEPLFRKDFAEILTDIAQLPVSLHLTTNGYFVDQHIQLLKKHVRSVNLSLDTLRKDRFQKITQRNAFERTLKNIDLLLDAGIKTKLNVVLVRNVNDDEISEFIALTERNPIEVRFIEFMPFNGNRWKLAQTFSQKEILETIEQNNTILPIEKEQNQTSQRFRVEGNKGTFGIISTVSHPFCSDCNRLRITADGKIKNCLFSSGETELRSLIDKPEELRKCISDIVSRKHFAHGGKAPMNQPNYDRSYNDNRTMTAIGG